MNATKFGKRLKEVIEHYSLSASAFAELINVQRSSISHVLSGRNKPSLDFITKLNSALPDVNLYWLLNGSGEMTLNPYSSVVTEKSDKIFENGENNSKNEIPSKNMIFNNAKSIARIVVFYNDGTFSDYTENENN
tara:strand:- start:580 stop:984 length:405 start_codon:yes stop_codon:yes gene_type:complete